MKTPEGALKDKIKKWLEARGAYAFMPVPTGYGKTTLDFLVCMPYQATVLASPLGKRETAWYGRFVAIETKAPGKVPTPRQSQVIREIQTAGGVAFYCDSFEDFLQNMVVYGFNPILEIPAIIAVDQNTVPLSAESGSSEAATASGRRSRSGTKPRPTRHSPQF